MLVRDRRNRRRYSRQDYETVRPRVLSMGEATAAEFPAEIELTWYEEDWSRGIGGHDNRTHPGYLRDSGFVTTRLPGALWPSGPAAAATLDSAPNGYFCSGFATIITDLATSSTYSIAESKSLMEHWAFIGNYVYRWTDDAGPQYNRIAQPLGNVAVVFKNAVRFGDYAFAPAWESGDPQQAATYIYKGKTDTGWTASTLAPHQFKFFAAGQNANGDDVLWGGYIISDSAIDTNEALDASETTIDVDVDPSTAILAGDIIRIGGIGGELMLVTISSATQGAGSTPGLEVVRGYAGTSGATHSTNADIEILSMHHIRSATDATNGGAWSTAAEIGAKDAPILGLTIADDNQSLYIFKTDGVWVYNPDGTTVRLTGADWLNGVVPTTFNLLNWNGRIIFSRDQSLFSLSGGAIKDISFNQVLGAPTLNKYHQYVAALAGSADGLFALVYDSASTKYYVLEGRDGADGRLVWDVIYVKAYTGSTLPIVTSLHLRQQNKLKVGLYSTTTNFTPIEVTINRHYNSGTTIYNSATEVEAITVEYDANLPFVTKLFKAVDVELDVLGTQTVELFYQLDNDGTWTSMGTVSTDGFNTIAFASGKKGKILSLRFLWSAAGSGATGILSFRVTGMIRPSAIKSFPLSVLLEDGQELLNGAIVHTSKSDLSKLEEWANLSTQLTLTEPDGTSRTVVGLPGTLTVKELSKEYGRNASYQADLLLAVVA